MTHRHVKECNVLWKIEKFSVCSTQNRHFIISPVFESKVVDYSFWRLVICIDHVDNNFSLNLKTTNQDVSRNTPKIVSFDVGLVNALGRTCYNQEVTVDLTQVISIAVPNLVSRSAVFDGSSQLLLKDALTLKGRIWKYTSRRASSEKVLLRSTLRTEELKVQCRLDPQNPLQTFLINSELVPGGYTLKCDRGENDPGVSFEHTETPPPKITIEPRVGKKTWTFMTAELAIVGRPREPVCTLVGSYHFGGQFEREWKLPEFEGPFDQLYYHSYYTILKCHFSISNLETESVWETSYTDTWYKVLEMENAQPRNILVNDMRPILQDSTFSDIIVQVGKVCIPAHRVVLSARSPIFHKLLTDVEKYLESPWRKNIQSLVRFFRRRTNVFEVESSLTWAVRESGLSLSKSNGRLSIVFSDVEERVVRKMVSFLYTDDLGCVDHDTVIQLLHASKRYRIPGLRFLCESLFQANSITIENAVRTLAVCHQYVSSNLTKKVLSFINENIECVLFHLDSLRSGHEDKKTAGRFGLVLGERRNTELFPCKKL